MTTILEALEAKRKAANWLQVCKDRHAANQRAIADLQREVADLERQQTLARKAKALGNAGANEPSASVIADRKLDFEGRQAAAVELATIVDRAQKTFEQAEADIVASAHRTVVDEYRTAAVSDFAGILEALFEQAQKIIAVDALVHYDLRPRNAPERNWRTLEERGGPAAQIIGQIQRLDWGTYPYSLRPSWAPKATPPNVVQLPGVQEAKSDILRELGLEGVA